MTNNIAAHATAQNTQRESTHSLNTVKTVFSESTVKIMESMLYNYWEDSELECLTSRLMQMLCVYIKNCPDDVPLFEKPEWMCKIVSGLIQLNTELVEIINDERVDKWIDTPDGWRTSN